MHCMSQCLIINALNIHAEYTKYKNKKTRVDAIFQYLRVHLSFELNYNNMSQTCYKYRCEYSWRHNFEFTSYVNIRPRSHWCQWIFIIV